jgi:hypothetical protein
MDGQRKKFEADWNISDLQVQADVFEDNQGKLIVNTPVEADLIETVVGRNAGNLSFDIKPMQEADVDQLQSARYILQYFLDKENFYLEKRNREYDKAKYGTAVFYCGLTMEIESIPTMNEVDDTKQ